MDARAKQLHLTPKRRALLKLLLQQGQEGGEFSIPSPNEQKPREDHVEDHVTDPPLSFAQERLWFLDQFESNLAVYNIPFTIRLQNALNQRAVERAVNEIVRRHGALRTTFRVIGERPVQIVAPYTPFELPTIDLSHRSPADRDAAIAGLVVAERDYKFDMAGGPLLRLVLVRLAELDHILLINVHHIVFDGWSMGVFMREFGALYEAFAANRASSLPEPPIQYVDFARRQREELSGDTLEALLAFWRKKLAGAPAVIELPTDRPHPKLQTFRGENQLFLVPRSIAQSLANLSRNSGTTLFMTLLAAFKILLNRYTGQTDLVVGTPIANRNRADIEPLIGFFVNTLVLRTDVSGNPTVRELLQRVRDATLEAYANQDLPFERLVQELQPERNLSHSPIFQVLFALQNASTAPTTAASAYSTTNGPTVVEGTAKFDLSLFLAETENGLAGEFEYNTALFDRSTATDIIRHFQRVLAAVAEDPNQHLSNVSLLDEQEIRRQVQRWVGPEVSLPPQACVHQLFEAQARATPERPAVVFKTQQISFRELDRRANRLALRLHELGVGPDVPVGMCLNRSFEAVMAILAILKAGGAYVPLDPSYPESRLAFMIEDAGIRILITSGKWRDLPLAPDIVTLAADEWGTDEEALEEGPECRAGADNLAYVIYTSGSTGRPKAVAMPHRPLVNLIQWQTGSAGFEPGTRALQFAPLSFDVSFQEMFSTWCSGGALVLVDESTRGDFEALIRYLDANAVDRLYLPPVALSHLAESASSIQVFPRSLSEIICAGEQLTVSANTGSFLQQIGAGLRNQYGPTETHVVTEFALPGDASSWPTLPPIGRPIDNVRLYILDEELRPVPNGIRGELYIGGTPLARGYVKRPALTAERFLPDPFGPSGARMYRTGDFVRLRPDGNLVFLGRVDGQVKIRGFRIDVGEVEAVLREHEDVAEAAVVVREDANGLKSLGAYVALKTGRKFVASELRQFLCRMLPEHFVPSSFWQLDALPVSPHGKIDRKALPIPESSTRGEGGFAAPRSDLEEKIARIWAGVLGLDRVGAEDNFFELGGHSLLATQVISRLRQLFNVNLPLRIMFEPSSTVVELARAVVVNGAERVGFDETASLVREIEQLTESELASELDAGG